MESLFRDFWWLLFPLAWIVGGGLSGFFRYRGQKATLDLIRTYAERGQEPPQALLDMVQRPSEQADFWDAQGYSRPRGSAHYWSLFGLFSVLAAGFAFAGVVLKMDGDSGAFLVVAFTMAAVAVWSLISAVVQQRSSR